MLLQPDLQVDRVIFCVFLNIDYKIYQQLLYYYFPPENPGESEGTPHRPGVGSGVLCIDVHAYIV